MVSRVIESLPRWLVHASSWTVIGFVLVAAGQPLFAEDVWWHLAMGEIHLAKGPWLAADPFLHTASAAPAPAAWLADIALYWVVQTGGFHGLRAFHVLLVGGILGVAWSLLRRVSGSAVFASLGTALFAALSAYRLFQLRPHLFSVLFALLLVRWLFDGPSPPSRRRVVASVGLLGVWANLHGAFMIGLVLVAAGLGGVLVSALLRSAQRSAELARARRLALVLVLGLLATLVNPSGPRQHLLYFVAGAETPDLALVSDEWAPVHLFEAPVPNLPPSPLSWIIVWALVGAVATATWMALRRRRRRRRRQSEPSAPVDPAPDPALLGLAWVGLVGVVAAVRLAWLGLLPLLILGAAQPSLQARRPRASVWAMAMLAIVLVPGFVRLGDWPMISRWIHPQWYARAFPATKFYAHSVWFMRDTELEGNLFNDYSDGNFIAYWLSPQLKAFVNGSLNVPLEAWDASRAILARRGNGRGESFGQLLDRYEVDVFFGTGVPSVSSLQRPVIKTTTHLEAAAGWKPVFRNLRSAVYLRDVERNRVNLLRVAEFYADADVPFDPESGFDVEHVILESPTWAMAHGLIPQDFFRLEGSARSSQLEQRAHAQDRLASIYAALGVYERAEAIDRRRLGYDPDAISASRRLVWSLLKQHRPDQARAAAERLAVLSTQGDALSQLLIDAPRSYFELDPEGQKALVAMLPLMTRPEGRRLLAGVREASTRPPRPR